MLPASGDAYIQTAAEEIQRHLDPLTDQPTLIIYGDVEGPAIRLDVQPNAPELVNRGDEAVHIYSDVNGIHIIGKTTYAVRDGAYIYLEKLGFDWLFKSPIWTELQ